MSNLGLVGDCQTQWAMPWRRYAWWFRHQLLPYSTVGATLESAISESSLKRKLSFHGRLDFKNANSQAWKCVYRPYRKQALGTRTRARLCCTAHGESIHPSMRNPLQIMILLLPEQIQIKLSASVPGFCLLECRGMVDRHLRRKRRCDVVGF